MAYKRGVRETYTAIWEIGCRFKATAAEIHFHRV